MVEDIAQNISPGDRRTESNLSRTSEHKGRLSIAISIPILLSSNVFHYILHLWTARKIKHVDVIESFDVSSGPQHPRTRRPTLDNHPSTSYCYRIEETSRSKWYATATLTLNSSRRDHKMGTEDLTRRIRYDARCFARTDGPGCNETIRRKSKYMGRVDKRLQARNGADERGRCQCQR